MDGAWIEFRVTAPDGSSARHRFDGEELLLGSGPGSGLSLNDPTLRPVHLRLLFGPEGWRAEDFGGGARIRGGSLGPRAPLGLGDVLSLGECELEILRLEPERRDKPGPVFEGDEESEALRATLRWYEERLQILNEAQRDLAGPVEMQEVLDLVLEMVFKHLGPIQAAVYLRGAGGGLSRLVAGQLHDDVPPLELPEGLMREVLPSGASAQVFDAAGTQPTFGGEARLAQEARSVVVAPLVGPRGPVGVLALSSGLEPSRFSVQDLDLLATLASAGALRIHSLALAEEAAERKRLEGEIALARRIQIGLLPSSLPELPGYRIHAVNLPYEGVSGDYYMVVPRAAGEEVALWVADVCGKGIAASLLMASLEALSAGPIEEGYEPDEILSRVSKLLYERTQAEKYATALLAILQPETGEVRYASAGHNPALVVQEGGGVEWLHSTGVPLGLLRDRAYSTRRVHLASGDLLALYTDGFSEARNPEDEEFGAHRLAGVCSRFRGEDLQVIVQEIDREMAAFVGGVPYDDDRTLVLLRRD
jgi:serine phosphatase RsbU (regulator of sigma subunit)